MHDAFSLLLPLAAQYRSLAAETAGRYIELAGGSADLASSMTGAVTAAIERVAAGASRDAEMKLACTAEAGGAQIELSCSGRRESVSVKIPVAKPAN